MFFFVFSGRALALGFIWVLSPNPRRLLPRRRWNYLIRKIHRQAVSRFLLLQITCALQNENKNNSEDSTEKLELIQTHMAQKPMLRVEVCPLCVARESKRKDECLGG
jgi:hypothetical protein